MAAFTHLGIGLAAKRVAPNVPVGVLVAGAYAIDIAWGGFFLAGMEKLPGPGIDSAAPWSHGLPMSLFWSALAAGIAALVTRNRRMSLLMGLLVFSHWVVDFIAKPMTFSMPYDVGVPVLFEGSPTIGLGVWRYPLGEYIGEYGTLAAGLLVYILTARKLKKAKALSTGQNRPVPRT